MRITCHRGCVMCHHRHRTDPLLTQPRYLLLQPADCEPVPVGSVLWRQPPQRLPRGVLGCGFNSPSSILYSQARCHNRPIGHKHRRARAVQGTYGHAGESHCVVVQGARHLSHCISWDMRPQRSAEQRRGVSCSSQPHDTVVDVVQMRVAVITSTLSENESKSQATVDCL